MLDLEKIDFLSEAGEVAHNLNASLYAHGADTFVDKIYTEYREAKERSRINQKKWLKNRLKNAFLYYEEAPVWIDDEPSWVYFEDSPMVFISQMKLKRNEFTEQYLTYDSVVYLFGIRKPGPSPESYEMEYVTISQHRSL